MNPNPEYRNSRRFHHQATVMLEDGCTGYCYNGTLYNYGGDGMYIESDYAPRPEAKIQIRIDNLPWENLDTYEISDFIDESIKNRTLLGYGSGPLTGDRLNVLKERIEAAGNVLANGTFEEACQQFLEAYLSTDGLSQPPDLVYGSAAPELAKIIKSLRIEIIGCE